MRKIFLILCFLFPSVSFADTPTSTLNWILNDGQHDCPSVNSHGVNHYGIPNLNVADSGISGGSVACTNHTYYGSSNHNVTFTANAGVHQCPAGERAVGITPNPCTSGTCTMTCQKYDDTPPTVSDITNTVPGNLEANDSYAYNISISQNGGSPIVQVDGSMEDKLKQSAMNTFSDTSSPWTQNWDISKVDNYRLFDSNTARQYTFGLTKIKDEAGNEWNGTQNYNHNVYANSSASTKEVTLAHKNDLEDINNIANGTIYPLNISLFDFYGNDIIPASGIGRTIDFNFNVTNTSNLNQYLRNGDAIYLNIPSTPTYSNRLTHSSSFDGQTSINGIYPFNFKIYTPTANIDSKAYGNFSINSITHDINHNATYNSRNKNSQSVNNSNISFKFGPLYATNFTGDIKTYGFIEGATQKSNINISKNGTASDLLDKLYVEFGSGTQTNSSSFNMKAGFVNLVGEGNTNYSLLQNFLSPIDTLNTLLTQVGSVSSLNNQYFSTHIAYTLDGLNIVYNSDIIGKSNYWGDSTRNNTTQAGLKVIGKTHDTNVNYIVDGQNLNINILGDLTKSSLKRDIRSNAFSIIKSINHTSTASSSSISNLTGTSWSTNAGGKLLNNQIIYYNLTGAEAGKNIVLNGASVGGNKTIIIKGGNLYITSNMNYSSTNSTLGIIVLKDDSGNGGNVYIKPSVTNIVGSIYADKSTLSYDTIYCISSGELTTSCGGTQAVLANQLYIYGQVFAENTIGGARATPLRCPYYITDSACTQEIAQKYDLNYLRRYYLYDSDSNGIGDKPTGKQYFSTSPNNAYPVVIKYNPQIQLTPPPLFTKQ